MDDLAKLRKSYERAELSESDSHADPMQQFALWLQQAIDAKSWLATPMRRCNFIGWNWSAWYALKAWLKKSVPLKAMNITKPGHSIRALALGHRPSRK